MKAHQMGLTALLQQRGTRFWVPVFQRPYSWGAHQCEDLWRDIMRAGHIGHPHFVGTVLCSVEEDSKRGKTMGVIDGQQRLATVSVLLAALAAHLRRAAGDGKSRDDSVADQVECCLFIDGLPRLELGEADQPAYLSLLERRSPAEAEKADDEDETARSTGDDDVDAADSLVLANFRLFASLMEQDDFDVDVLVRGLRALDVIYATLGPDDQPQLVFESLNSKGMPLTNADLIRNALLVATDFDDQARLYERYWQPLEKLFDSVPDRITAAVHAWLAIRFRRVGVHDPSEVYRVFKIYLDENPDVDAEGLLSSLLAFCRQFAGSAGMRERSSRDAHSWIDRDADQLVSKRHMFGD